MDSTVLLLFVWMWGGHDIEVRLLVNCNSVDFRNGATRKKKVSREEDNLIKISRDGMPCPTSAVVECHFSFCNLSKTVLGNFLNALSYQASMYTLQHILLQEDNQRETTRKKVFDSLNSFCAGHCSAVQQKQKKEETKTGREERASDGLKNEWRDNRFLARWKANSGRRHSFADYDSVSLLRLLHIASFISSFFFSLFSLSLYFAVLVFAAAAAVVGELAIVRYTHDDDFRCWRYTHSWRLSLQIIIWTKAFHSSLSFSSSVVCVRSRFWVSSFNSFFLFAFNLNATAAAAMQGNEGEEKHTQKKRTATSKEISANWRQKTEFYLW